MTLNKLKFFFPPVFIDLIRKYIGYFGYAIWEYAPKGFNTQIKSGGWDLEGIAVLQSEKWEGYASRIKSKKNIGVNHGGNY